MDDKEIEAFRKSTSKKITLALDTMDTEDSIEMNRMAETCQQPLP